MSSKMYSIISGVVFLLVALAHLARVFEGLEFRVGSWDLPAWASIVAAIVAGFLSFSGLRIASRT